MIKMKNNKNGGQPKWKMTTMEDEEMKDDQNGCRLKWKTTKMEDDQNGN